MRQAGLQLQRRAQLPRNHVQEADVLRQVWRLCERFIYSSACLFIYSFIHKRGLKCNVLSSALLQLWGVIKQGYHCKGKDTTCSQKHSQLSNVGSFRLRESNTSRINLRLTGCLWDVFKTDCVPLVSAQSVVGTALLNY